jgi:hypothetical protein
LADVRFSNRPFGVKCFQAFHDWSVDVAHGLVLLFGIGTKGPSIMGIEDEVEQSLRRPYRKTNDRSKRTYEHQRDTKMANIVLLFLCLTIGIVLRASKRVPDNGYVGINASIVHVSLPALILGQIHNVELTPGLLSAAMMPWLLFALSAVIFAFVGLCLSEIKHARTDDEVRQEMA